MTKPVHTFTARHITPLFAGTPEHVVEYGPQLVCWCSTAADAGRIAQALNNTPLESPRLHLVKTMDTQTSVTNYFLISDIWENLPSYFTDDITVVTEIFSGEVMIAREIGSTYQNFALLGKN
jgi:hypothetical protein